MNTELIINGKSIVAQSGQTIVEAARANGITIPTLCYHKDLSPVGSCRLCLVEIDGMRGEHAACTTRIGSGMVVHTESPTLSSHRQMILEFLLENYYDAGYALGDRKEDTEFIHWVKTYQARIPSKQKPHVQVDSDPNPFVWVDMNKCILCTRCVRACAEVQGRYVWGVAQRGMETKIIAGADTAMLDARCESCGACVAYCPTGALDNRIGVGKGTAEKKVTTTCSYCGVGCQFDLNVIGNRVVRVTSHPTAEPNGMHLCVKGRYGYDYVQHPERLLKPRVRKYLLDGKAKSREGDAWDWVETDWETALGISARKFVEVKKQTGSNAIGVLTSAKCTNEENYLMQKFSRQVLGTHNIDHCARL